MNKLLEEQVVYGMPEDLKESYDHELAMKDEGYRDGVKEGYASGHKDGYVSGQKDGLEQGITQEN